MNLLVVYLAALADAHKVGQIKRTENFRPVDALFLLERLPKFRRRFTTPGILAEASNLLEPYFWSLPPARLEWLRTAIREELSVVEEVHVPAKGLGTDPLILQFGFTDLSIAFLAGDETMVLTSDVDLAVLLERRKLPCVNYNHLRLRMAAR